MIKDIYHTWFIILSQFIMAIEGELSMLIHEEHKHPGPLYLAKLAWPSEEILCLMHMYLEYLSVLDQVSMVKDKDYTSAILLSQVSMNIIDECTILLSQANMAIGGECMPFSLSKSAWPPE
jgi:hypothetical protein